MHVPIQHIIGTVALISLVITATLAYSIVSSSVTTDLQKQQLQQIAESTAKDIVELVNIAKFSVYNYEPVTKSINLPTDVAGSTYTVQLVDGTSEGKGYYVKATLATNKHITAESAIPLNYTGNSNLILYNDQTTKPITDIGLDKITVQTNGVVYGKPSTVIWAQAVWDQNYAVIDSIQVGLGWT